MDSFGVDEFTFCVYECRHTENILFFFTAKWSEKPPKKRLNALGFSKRENCK